MRFKNYANRASKTRSVGSRDLSREEKYAIKYSQTQLNTTRQIQALPNSQSNSHIEAHQTHCKHTHTHTHKSNPLACVSPSYLLQIDLDERADRGIDRFHRAFASDHLLVKFGEKQKVGQHDQHLGAPKGGGKRRGRIE